MVKFNNILFTFTLLLLCLNIILANNKAKTRDQKVKEREKDDEKIEADDSKKNKTKHPKMEEYSKNAHLRPTKCQVCRVLVQELEIEVDKTSSIKSSVWLTNRLDGEDNIDERKGKKITYKKSEMRLMDILEYVCKNVYNYRSIAGPEFPYLKGETSPLQTMDWFLYDNVMKGLKEMKQVALASEASKTFLDFITQHQENENLCQNTGVPFLIESTKTEHSSFPYKTAKSEANNKANRRLTTKWTYHKERSFAIKSMFRQNLEEMVGKNGLQLKLDAPEEMVEDPTFELKRMMFQCNQMVEEYEDDITEWYMKAQETDPIDFLCAERILKSNQTDCLHASTVVPDFAPQPLRYKPGEEQLNFVNGAKMEL